MIAAPTDVVWLGGIIAFLLYVFVFTPLFLFANTEVFHTIIRVTPQGSYCNSTTIPVIKPQT